MEMVLFRVINRGRADFGPVKVLPEVGDVVRGVYATPHTECVARMCGHNNDLAYDWSGGHSRSYVLVFEGLGEEDYYRPEPNSRYDSKYDLDEVIIREGTISEILTQEEFADRFQIRVVGFYEFMAINPKNN